MRKSLIAASVLAALSIGTMGAAQAAPDTYNIDGSHTIPRFSYNHLGMSTQVSRFNKTTGTVVLDKAAKTGSVDVVIDITSVDTGFAPFNGHIQGEDFLDAAKFPTATFKSTKVIFEGDKPSAVEGNLTIKGITQKVSFPAKVSVAGKKVTATGQIKFDRTKFEIKFRKKKYFCFRY